MVRRTMSIRLKSQPARAIILRKESGGPEARRLFLTEAGVYSTMRSLGSLEPISAELAIASKASSMPSTVVVV